MRTLEEIKNILVAHREKLNKKFTVRNIGIFGSFAKGKQGKNSDLDIIIEFVDEESIKGFDYIRVIRDLEEYLEKILDVKVHVASKKHAESSDKWAKIKNDIVYVFKEYNNEVQQLKKIITKCLEDYGIKVRTIILFGSRGRGEFEEDSDWDILIVVDKDLISTEKRKLWSKVSEGLHKHFPFFPFDIIIKSSEDFEKEKVVVNTISNEAYLDGVKI